MNVKRFLATSLFALLAYMPFAQVTPADSLFIKELDEVVLTATRNERKLSNVAVPTSVISQKSIQQAGSSRLKDILLEQTGLFLTSGFGVGVQMQGLNPDYTLILIDGEPLVGRTAGVLDLNRITVGNIKKIEIVKGPSSSLYGSEALAGVINIITDRSYNKKANVAFRYGTYNTIDASIAGSARAGKLGVNAFINTYKTDGYSIRPNSVERSKLPVWRVTPQLQFDLPVSDKTNISLSLRYNYEHIKNELAVANNGQIIYSKGRELNKDLNVTPSLSHRFSESLKSSLRLYGSVFEGSQKLNTTTGLNYDDLFKQQFYRVENQTDYSVLKNVTLVAGIGYVKEFANSTRYNDKSSKKENEVKYGFLQSEWKPLDAFTVIGGLRYDDNKLYASAFSPKIAMLYKFSERFRVQASFGRGFKAPDFRQLYLNFTNTAAGSYSVFGVLEGQRIIRILDEQGLIQEFEPAYYQLQDLRPEFSSGWNAGFVSNPITALQWQLNFFRNDIEDLIESRQVATRVDNSQIFSYINVKNAYTQGIETNLRYQLNKFIAISAGYQFLLTADKDELEKIRKDFYYTRDENNFSRVLGRKDYEGLPNRSKHMANLKLSYEDESRRWFGNVRTIYRSKWVVFDKDGNGIYNKQDEFADAFIMINMSAGKSFNNGLRIQAGCDNLLNYSDVNNLPNMAGRVLYAAVAYNFSNKKSEQ